jgi:hypothetical protein
VVAGFGLAKNSRQIAFTSTYILEVLTFLMKGETGERWRTLCQQAQTEQDPDELMEIIREINRLLDEKEQRLRNQRQDQGNSV